MAKKREQCEKCKQLHYCDKHHILPKALFSEGETVLLCKNCHDELHRGIGHRYLRKENQQPMEFYIEKYIKWLFLLITVGIFLPVLIKYSISMIYLLNF